MSSSLMCHMHICTPRVLYLSKHRQTNGVLNNLGGLILKVPGFSNIIGTGSNGQDEAAIYPTLYIFLFDPVQSVLNSSSLEETMQIQPNLKSRNLSLLLYSTYISDAVTGWTGWALVHSEFVSSVNSIPTRGQIMPTTLLLSAGPPGFENLTASLHIQIIK